MDFDEFNNKLDIKLKKINVELTKEQAELMFKYMTLVCEWNEKINLTSIVEPNEFILKHLVDSIVILKYINNNDRIIDIGTGAGFPGIPLNIMKNKDVQYTLVDSLNKRIVFLENVVNELNLENIELIHSRVEDLAIKKEYREKYSLVVSRAVAPLNILVEYMLPFIKIGGKCICMKGSKLEDELAVSKKAVEVLGGKIIDIEKLNLPDSDIERNIVIIEKIKETNMEYPRKAGVAKKHPII